MFSQCLCKVNCTNCVLPCRYQCIENDLLYPLRTPHNIAPYKSKGLDRASELHICLDSAEQSSPSMKCSQDEHKSQAGLCSESGI